MTTNKLTQEEKRIKIAEACGWEFVEYPDPIYRQRSFWKAFYKGVNKYKAEDYDDSSESGIANDRGTRYISDFSTKEAAARYLCPDYFGDLNACQSAWETLTSIQHEQFKWHLVRVVREVYESTGKKHSVTCAPACLRADALGRTLEAWEAGQ